MRNFNLDFRGFYVTVEVRANTIYAFWCNHDYEQSRVFSGYSVNEVKQIVREDITDYLEALEND